MPEKAKNDAKKARDKKEEKAIEPEVVGELTKDDKLMATLAHILGLFTHIIAPLIIFLLKKDESEFIAENSKEALNFQLTMLIGWFIGAFTAWIIIGLFIMLLVVIFELIFCIQAAMAAHNGNIYKYPISFRFIK